MQDLLAGLLWRNVEIDEAAERLKRTLPGFAEAERELEDLAGQLQAIAGYDLYDQYASRLARCIGYEAQAYYALGLGLRGELVRGLELSGGAHSPK